jgi:biotin operon repressor
MFELPKIIKSGPSQKDKLNAEKQALEKEIQELMAHGGVSESQIWHKKARIQAIDKEIKALETKGFNAGNDKLKSMMEAQNGKSLSPEQMAAAMGAGRE